jgi:hypothetical protein
MNVDLAEQLVEITLLRAGAVMKPSNIGPNLSAWLFSRLRQYYYHEYGPPGQRPRREPPQAGNHATPGTKTRLRRSPS